MSSMPISTPTAFLRDSATNRPMLNSNAPTTRTLSRCIIRDALESFRVLAIGTHQHDRANHGDDQQHGSDLERQHEWVEQRLANFARRLREAVVLVARAPVRLDDDEDDHGAHEP